MKVFYIIILSFLTSFCFSQQKIKYQFDQLISINLDNDSIYKSTDILKTRNRQLVTLEKIGFFNYSIVDSIITNSTYTYKIKLGSQTKKIIINNIDPKIADFLKTKSNTLTVSPALIPELLQNLKSYYTEKGQVFTKISFTNFNSTNDTIFCQLNILESSLRKISKTIIKGYTNFPERFIKHYIKPNSTYQKNYLEIIHKKLNQLDFISIKQKPAVLFTQDSTLLYLYIEQKKKSEVDALLGFNNQSNSKKLSLNGHINFDLTNTFNKGEKILFKWDNNGNSQQNLTCNITQPYIFNSPISPSYLINIYKNENNFINNNQVFKLHYQPHYLHKVGFLYQMESSNVISENTANNTFNYEKKLYGLNYQYQEKNILFPIYNSINLDIAIGNKTSTYNQTQIEIVNKLSKYLQLNKVDFIHFNNKTGYLHAKEIYQNELFRIGGANSIRGFLEQSLTANLYSYTNIEFQHYTNSLSYLYAFSDIGYLENPYKNKLLSFGLGYTIGKPNNLIKISYALGKTNTQPFNFKQGLFHINLITIL